jgi:hypothetical protein
VDPPTRTVYVEATVHPPAHGVKAASRLFDTPAAAHGASEHEPLEEDPRAPGSVTESSPTRENPRPGAATLHSIRVTAESPSGTTDSRLYRLQVLSIRSRRAALLGVWRTAYAATRRAG